jgi:exoribonuclease R
MKANLQTGSGHPAFLNRVDQNPQLGPVFKSGELVEPGFDPLKDVERGFLPTGLSLARFEPGPKLGSRITQQLDRLAETASRDDTQHVLEAASEELKTPRGRKAHQVRSSTRTNSRMDRLIEASKEGPVRGRLESRLQRDTNGELRKHEVIFKPDDFRIPKVNLDPKAVKGLPIGGPVSLRFKGNAGNPRIEVDKKNTDYPSSMVGVVRFNGNEARVVARDPMTAPYPELPLIGGDRSLDGKTVLAHVHHAKSEKHRSATVEATLDTSTEPRSLQVRQLELASEHGIATTYPPEVKAQIRKLVEAVRKHGIEPGPSPYNPELTMDYEDMTDVPLVAVDNGFEKRVDELDVSDDAKATIRKLAGGAEAFFVTSSMDPDQAAHKSDTGKTVKLTYALSDPMYFSPSDSPMFQHGVEKAFTSYMNGFDAPILPTVLSEYLAGLFPGEGRPSFVVELEVDKETGEIVPDSIQQRNGIVANRANGNYPEAQAHLDGKKTIAHEAYAADVELLEAFGKARMKHALERGVASFGGTERPGVWIDKEGSLHVGFDDGELDVMSYNAEQSVAVNHAAALLGARIQRFHPPPSDRKMEALSNMSAELAAAEPPDPRLAWDGDPQSLADYVHMLKTEFDGDPRQPTLLSLAVRTNQKAYYGTEPREDDRSSVETDHSHYGLALSGYSRVTAPMREWIGVLNQWDIRAQQGHAKPPPAKMMDRMIERSNLQEFTILNSDNAAGDVMMAHLFAKAGLEGQRVQARVHDVNPGGLSLRVNVPVEQNGSTEHFELPLFVPAKVMSKQVPGRIEPNEGGTQLRWENRQGEDLVYKAATFIEVDIDHIDRHHGEIFALPTDLKQAAAERAPQDGGERGGRRGAHRDSGSAGARRRKAI